MSFTLLQQSLSSTEFSGNQSGEAAVRVTGSGVAVESRASMAVELSGTASLFARLMQQPAGAKADTAGQTAPEQDGPASLLQQVVTRAPVKERESGAEQDQTPKGRMPSITSVEPLSVPNARFWHQGNTQQSAQLTTQSMRFGGDGSSGNSIDLNVIDDLVNDFVDAMVGLVADVGDIVKDMVDQFTDSFDDLLGDLFG